HNLITDPGFSGSDFFLHIDSPAIDSGVDVGLPFNGSAPDIGAFETVPLVGCTVASDDPSRITCDFENNVHPPLAPATDIAGWSVARAGAADPVASVVAKWPGQVQIQVAIAFAAGDSCSLSYTPGDLSDSALIGGSMTQPVAPLVDVP